MRYFRSKANISQLSISAALHSVNYSILFIYLFIAKMFLLACIFPHTVSLAHLSESPS